MNGTTPPGVERSQFLQVMRFVAAALVLYAHATFYYHERVSAEFPVWGPGGVGVPIFFAISGIVMVLSAQALTKDAAGARKFLVRRIIRIVPLWWLAVSIKVIIALAQPEMVNHNHFRADYAIKSYLLIPYFNEQHAVVPLHGVGWTLLHEMFFYLLFTLALLCGRQPALWVSGVIVALWWAGKQWSVDSPYWVVATSSANLQFVLGMAVGSFLAQSHWPRRWHVAAALALAACAVLLEVLPATADLHFTYTVLLAFAAATLLLSGQKPVAALKLPDRLGDSSYSLYLFHPFVAPAAAIGVARLMPGVDPGWHLLLVTLFTIAVCHGLHLVAEVPLVRWARRAFGETPPRRAAGTA